MIPDLIRKQIRQGEGNGTEFKPDIRNLETIARTVCAFLNTLGGTVFCGVDDKGRLVGVEGAKDQLQIIHAYLLESITPKALLTVNVDDEDGKTIISIEVPEGKDRPYVLPVASTCVRAVAHGWRMLKSCATWFSRNLWRPNVGSGGHRWPWKKMIWIGTRFVARRSRPRNPVVLRSLMRLTILRFCRRWPFIRRKVLPRRPTSCLQKILHFATRKLGFGSPALHRTKVVMPIWMIGCYRGRWSRYLSRLLRFCRSTFAGRLVSSLAMCAALIGQSTLSRPFVRVWSMRLRTVTIPDFPEA